MKLRGYWPTGGSLARQSGMLAIGRGGAKAANFVGYLLIARALGPAAYGGLIFALSVGSVLIFIPNMGLDPLYSREVPAGSTNARDLLAIVLRLKVLGSGLFLAAYLGVLYLSATSAAVRGSALIIAFALILNAIGDTWRTVLISGGRAGLAGALEVIPAFVLVLASISVISRIPTIASAAWSLLAGQVVAGILGALVVLRMPGKPAASGSRATLVRVLKMAGPLMLIWFLSDLYLRVDMTLVFYLRGDSETGLYGASYRLVDGMCSAALVVCSVALPRMASAWTEGVERWRHELKRARQLVLLIALPVAVILTAFPKPIIVLLYGSKFTPAAESLRILGPAGLLLGLGFVYGAALTSTGLVWAQFRITVYALIANVLLNLVWIPRYGGPGAALATVVAGLGYLGMAHYIVQRHLPTLGVMGSPAAPSPRSAP